MPAIELAGVPSYAQQRASRGDVTACGFRYRLCVRQFCVAQIGLPPRKAQNQSL